MALLMLTGLLVDLAKIKVAQNQLRRVANSSARSVLANYNTTVKNEYNLFIIQQSDYNKDFAHYIKANLSRARGQQTSLLDSRLETSRFYPVRTLRNDLQQQILEDMKYQAPLNLTRDLLDKFRAVGKLGKLYEEENEKRKSLSKINDKMRNIQDSNKVIKDKKDEIKQRLEEIKKNNDTIVNQDETIKKLKMELTEELKRDKELSNEIEAELKKMEEKRELSIYDSPNQIDNVSEEQLRQQLERNKPNLQQDLDVIKKEITETEAALNSDITEENYDKIGIDSVDKTIQKLDGSGKTVNVQDEEVLKRKRDLVKENEPELAEDTIDRDIEKYNDNSAQRDQANVNIFKKIFSLINDDQGIYKLRDEIFINEYTLTHFSYTTGEPKGSDSYGNKNTEVEYILYGGDKPKTTAMKKIWEIRFAFDSAAYFALSKNAPPHPIARAIVSLVAGSLQASIDTYELAKGQEVAIAEVFPPETNPFKNISVSYKDHLRLLLLLNEKSKEQKLDSIMGVLQLRSGLTPTESKTVFEGKVGISVRLWFLPLSGIKNVKNGPFGSEIKNGRAYIYKEVQYGY